MSFISWIFFCLFGGVGIPAMPLDLIYDFCTRPKKRTLDEMNKIQQEILLATKKAKSLATDIKDLETQGHHKKFCNASFEFEFNFYFIYFYY